MKFLNWWKCFDYDVLLSTLISTGIPNHLKEINMGQNWQQLSSPPNVPNTQNLMSIWLSNIDSEVKDEDGCWGWGRGDYPPITVCMMREPPQKIPISFKLACQSFLMLCDLMAVSMMSADPRLWVVTHIDTSSRSVCVQALLRRSPRNQPQ